MCHSGYHCTGLVASKVPGVLHNPCWRLGPSQIYWTAWDRSQESVLLTDYPGAPDMQPGLKCRTTEWNLLVKGHGHELGRKAEVPGRVPWTSGAQGIVTKAGGRQVTIFQVQANPKRKTPFVQARSTNLAWTIGVILQIKTECWLLPFPLESHFMVPPAA